MQCSTRGRPRNSDGGAATMQSPGTTARTKKIKNHVFQFAKA